MILLADGGSTKVDWRLIDNGKEIKQVTTKGINPYFATGEDVINVIKTFIFPAINGYRVDTIYFYGAGCTPEKVDSMKEVIADSLIIDKVHVYSDLIAAARGLCNRNKGIACILGTGSNSCYYDGEKVVENISPLGYILGDEGSGAVLGKLFAGACLKSQLDQSIKKAFLEEHSLTQAQIIENVYKQPQANRFLASFAPFILKQIEHKTVYNLVYFAFKEFFTRNVMQYDYKNNTVHFTGSVAYHFRDILNRVGEDLDIKIGTIVQSPTEGLIKYHCKNVL